MLKKIELPPGIHRDSTRFSTDGRWYDTNNMRFRGGVPEVIGGWKRDSSADLMNYYTLEGIGRAIFTSRDYEGYKYISAGTSSKLYVVVDGVATDITPVRDTDPDPLGSPTPFETGAAGETVVTVDDNLTNPSVGDYVVYSGAATVDGILNTTLNRAEGFKVIEIDPDDSNKYRIDTGAVCSSGGVSGGGASVKAYHKVESGTNTAATGDGWGAGSWDGVGESSTVPGEDRDWGEPSSTTIGTGLLRRVYIDNYNEDLMFANSGGPIYYWDVSENSTNGVPTGGEDKCAVSLRDIDGQLYAPKKVDSFLVSKRDGHCVALGCNDLGAGDGDPLNALMVRWSDQNNPFDWLPTSTNTSGGQVLRVGSRIICGISTKDEVIIFTDAAVYAMRFIGPPDTFGFTLITEGVEIVSSRAAVNASNAVFFMGNDGFYRYAGSVSPLPCPVAKYVFDDFNRSERPKCFGCVNSGFSEVMWFYPSKDSFEPNRYVLFNYEENVWSIGKFDMDDLKVDKAKSDAYSRTSWRDSIGLDNPLATYIYNYDPVGTALWETTVISTVEETSTIMVHEIGASAAPDPIHGGGGQVGVSCLDAHIESGDVAIGEGDEFSFVSRILPDLEVFNSDVESATVNVLIQGRDFPGSANTLFDSTKGDGGVGGVSSPFVNQPVADVDVTFNLETGRYRIGPFDSPGDPMATAGNATSVRGRARTISMKFSSAGAGFQWRTGAMRLDIKPDGRR